jgi:hypothetical protein
MTSRRVFVVVVALRGCCSYHSCWQPLSGKRYDDDGACGELPSLPIYTGISLKSSLKCLSGS